MASGQRGINPIGNWPSWLSNQLPPVLKCCRLLTKPQGLSDDLLKMNFSRAAKTEHTFQIVYIEDYFYMKVLPMKETKTIRTISGKYSPQDIGYSFSLKGHLPLIGKCDELTFCGQCISKIRPHKMCSLIFDLHCPIWNCFFLWNIWLFTIDTRVSFKLLKFVKY